MTKKTAGLHSWSDPRLAVRASLIEGQGCFARDRIAAGAVVVRWRGDPFTAENAAGWVEPSAETSALASPEGATANADEFLNHSCTPNLWLQEEELVVVGVGGDTCTAKKRTAEGIECWSDPRLAVRASPIEGQGCFARDRIAAGAVVVRWRGDPFTAENAAGWVEPSAETSALASPEGATANADEFLNHSCTPNLWLRDAVTLVTRRPIARGEELTVDYASWGSNGQRTLPWLCRCGSENCRGQIMGRD